MQISVPFMKYAHLCRGYLSTKDEEILYTRTSSVFGVQLDQLRTISSLFTSAGEMEYILIVIPVPTMFPQAIVPKLKKAGFSEQFTLALQLCALSGIDMVRFSDAGADIPGINKARKGTDAELSLMQAGLLGEDEDSDDSTGTTSTG